MQAMNHQKSDFYEFFPPYKWIKNPQIATKFYIFNLPAVLTLAVIIISWRWWVSRIYSPKILFRPSYTKVTFYKVHLCNYDTKFI